MIATIKYLKRYSAQEARIGALLEQIAGLREQLTTCTQRLSGQPRGSRSGDSLSSAIAKIEELEGYLDERIDESLALKKEIVERIEAVENDEHRTILYLRYINLKTWEQIATNMGYDVSWLHRLHGKALREAEKLLISERSH